MRWSRTVDVTAGQAETRDVPLVRGATVVGRVVDEQGVPIENAAVQVTRGGEGGMRDFVRRMRSRGESVRTDRNGTFTATRLTPGRGQRLDVRHDDYEDRSLGGLDLEPGATSKGVRVVLRRGLEVRGVVKDEEERPLAGVEVELQQSFTFRARRGAMAVMMPDRQPRRETGADGRFRFPGLKAGDYTLTARRPGLRSGHRRPGEGSEDGEVEEARARAGPRGDDQRLPPGRLGRRGGGLVRQRLGGGQGRRGLGPGGTRTEEPSGPDGAFLIEGLAEGEAYDLQPMGLGRARHPSGRGRGARPTTSRSR